jgi:hypothetical protein
VPEDEEDYEAVGLASRRENWTEVEQLGREDTNTRVLQSAVHYATMDNGPEPAPSTCVSVFPQDQIEGGSLRFTGRGSVAKRLFRLKCFAIGHVSTERAGKGAFAPAVDEVCDQGAGEEGSRTLFRRTQWRRLVSLH